MTTSLLDVKGLKCPLPVLRANKALKGMSAGSVLEVQATDPGTVADFETYCETAGHDLVQWREEDGVYSFLIRKA